MGLTGIASVSSVRVSTVVTLLIVSAMTYALPACSEMQMSWAPAPTGICASTSPEPASKTSRARLVGRAADAGRPHEPADAGRGAGERSGKEGEEQGDGKAKHEPAGHGETPLPLEAQSAAGFPHGLSVASTSWWERAS